ncbi:hypothetical protein T07_4095 [Trichinella nelsoni]|uniref:Uncharacterized protein n=1 Tax=Trichinella nelsoni TaxID=6336 RepID=A0A0V0RCK0_9BILA|nr:hypothetical protein T07_4095 [Trichinella nelsoni]
MLDGLFSLTLNMIAFHGIFQMLDRVSFSSCRPSFTKETSRSDKARYSNNCSIWKMENVKQIKYKSLDRDGLR